MKKLMFTAAAVAMAGGAFAAPLVYDYKASVKHMYLKDKQVVAYDGNPYHLYLKVIRSANLKGYLVMDQDGVTSATITGSAATCFDYGRNRGFLVVANENVPAPYYGAKILPAVLDAKYIDQRYDTNPAPTTGVAEGTLFCGGDSVACVRTQLDMLAGVRTERAAAPAAPGASTPGMAAFADYAWTSVMLFGMYNSPLWQFDPTAGVGKFDNFEAAWDGNLPLDLQRGFVVGTTVGVYHDTWMNGAGFGKYVRVNPTGLCCGFGTSGGGITLDTLSGAVKGGLWLCTDNAIDVAKLDAGLYNFFDNDNHRWDDQFNTQREDNAATFSFGDGWQTDLWQDGAMEQETTDVISGTWSIKLNQKFLTKAGVLKTITKEEVQSLFPGIDTTKAGTEAIAGINLLCSTLKSAALKLDPSQNIADGTDIHLYTKAQWASKSTNLPFLTPAFCKYFGLDAWN